MASKNARLTPDILDRLEQVPPGFSDAVWAELSTVQRIRTWLILVTERDQQTSPTPAPTETHS